MTGWVFSANGSADTTSADPADHLDICIEVRGTVTEVVLRGPLCAFTASYFRREVERLVDHGRHHFVIDAGGVTTLTSDGVDVLESLLQRVHRDGGSLAVGRRSAITDRVLDLCGVAATLGDALGDRGRPGDG